MGNPIKAITSVFKGPSKPKVIIPPAPPAPKQVTENRDTGADKAAAAAKKKLRKARGARQTLSSRGFQGVDDTLLGPKTNKL